MQDACLASQNKIEIQTQYLLQTYMT